MRAGTSSIQDGRLETNDIWSKEYLLQNCLTHHMTACGTGCTSIISDLNDDNLGSNLVFIEVLHPVLDDDAGRVFLAAAG